MSFPSINIFKSLHKLSALIPSKSSSIVVLLFSFFVVYAYGGVISDSNIYGEKSSAIGSYFAVGQLVFYFLVSNLLVRDILKAGFIRLQSLCISAFACLICSSGGGRLDFIPQILIIILLYLSLIEFNCHPCSHLSFDLGSIPLTFEYCSLSLLRSLFLYLCFYMLDLLDLVH